jgi:hypothetical protein
VNDVIVGVAAKAGASRPSTSKATATPTPATRLPNVSLKELHDHILTFRIALLPAPIALQALITPWNFTPRI